MVPTYVPHSPGSSGAGTTDEEVVEKVGSSARTWYTSPSVETDGVRGRVVV